MTDEPTPPEKTKAPRKRTPRAKASKTSPRTVFDFNAGGESPIQSSYVETINGKNGPAVMIRIEDLPGLTANLDGLQAKIANQGTELKTANDRIDTLTSRLWIAYILLLGAVIALGAVADYVGLFREAFGW